MNLSALMTAYNLAKHLARRTGFLDPKRTDRALGCLMARGRMAAKRVQYGSTSTWCDCPDSRFRRVRCKHVIALIIAEKHDRIMADFRGGGR